MRTRSSAAAVLGAIALASGTLSACGSSDSSSSAYCKDLKADKTYFDSFGGSNPDLSKLDDAFKRMHSLAGEAPDAVAKDWKVLDGELTTVEDALKEAGITFSDLAKLQQGQTPAGVDVDKLQALAPKLQALGDAKFTAASKAIEKHGKKVCKVDLTS